MAYKEVVVEESDLGSFFKFDAIGTKLVGRFVAFQVKPSNFADGKPEQLYTFKTREGLITVNAPTDLARKLEAAKKSGDLKPGHMVSMSYDRDLPATKPGYSPMKIIKTAIDDAPPPAAVKAPAPDPEDLPF